jgi:Condensation domain
MLLELRLAGQRATSVQAPDAEPAATDRLPLSYEQRRLWFLNRLADGETAYNVGASYRLRGPLDEDALTRAFDTLLARHAILRARFGEEGGTPHQTIAPEARAAIDRSDLTAERTPALAARAELAKWFGQELSLADGPLLRVRLDRLGADEHVLGLLVHHIVFDRASLALVADEVSALYAESLGVDVPARPVPTQYAAYVFDQMAADHSLEEQLSFWRAQIAGAPGALELPYDRARPAQLSPQAGEVQLELETDASSRIRELAGSERTTPFVVGLAALQALFLKYDPTASAVTIGCPANGRESERYARTIGFFVRSLPVVLRRPLRPNTTLRELVRVAREAYLSSHDHRDVPFDELVRISGAPRQLGLNPLFQVWYDLALAAPGATERWSLPGIDVEQFESGLTMTRFDLEFHLHDDGDRLGFRLMFAASLFELETGARIARHYQRVLRSFAADPDTPLTEVELLSIEERETLVEKWSRAS